MSTDSFTIVLGMIAVGFFMVGHEVFVSLRSNNKNQTPGLGLMAELLLLMYALMSHDVFVAGGQAVILVLTILILFRNGGWNKIPTTIKIISFSTPLLTLIALMIASTYQYRMSIPGLPPHFAMIGVTAYAFLIGNLVFGLTKRDYSDNTIQMKICSLAGSALLICYSAFRTDVVILIIGSSNVLRILQEITKDRRQRLVRH